MSSPSKSSYQSAYRHQEIRSLVAKMNTWAIFLAAFLAFAATANAQKKVVCYFGSWAVYRPGDGKFDISYIQPNLCTHLIYTFVGITTDGNVKVLDAWQDLPDEYGKDGFGRFNKLREQNPAAKTLIAIGGWNEGSSKYSQVVANPATRARFVQNVVAFVKKHNFDGFDLDWEYPNQRGGVPADVQNFVLLCKELRAEFDKHGYILSAAVGAAEPSASQSYDIAAISKYLHFINIMTYDFHGAWESQTGHNAPLYKAQRESGNALKLNVDAAVKYWLAQGCPPEKLILGLPFYGRGFTLANPSNHGVGAPTTGPSAAGPFTRENGMLGYNEICDMLKSGGYTVERDQEQRVPFMYKGNQWIGFDDVASIKEKTEYINKHGLGGAMVWSIETDDFHGKCGEKYPLLKAINSVLGNSIPPNTDRPKPPTGTTPSPTPRPTQPPTSSPNPPPTGTCSKEGYVADKNDCNVFYLCQKVGNVFQATRFQCGNGLGFDERINGCNFKNSVPACN